MEPVDSGPGLRKFTADTIIKLTIPVIGPRDMEITKSRPEASLKVEKGKWSGSLSR